MGSLGLGRERMVESVCPIPGCYCTTPTGRMAPWNVSPPENNGTEIPVSLKVKGDVVNKYGTVVE